MTRTTPHLNLSTRAAIDFAAGIALILAPPLLSFSVPAAVVSVILGALLTGTGLNLATRSTGPVGAHRSFNSAFVVVAAVATLVLACTAGGQRLAVLFLAAVVVIEALAGAVTRYTAAR